MTPAEVGTAVEVGQPGSGRGGRPRDPRLHEAIADATIALLAEAGYEALTMEAVSCRAGTTKAAIYRRWTSKAALVADVFAARAETAMVVPDTGSVRGDLLAHVRNVIAAFGAPVGRAVLNVVTAGRSHPDLAEPLRTGFVRRRRQAVAEILARGIGRGEIPAGADAGLAADLLLGPVYYRLLVSGEPVDATIAPALVEAALGAVTGPARPPSVRPNSVR